MKDVKAINGKVLVKIDTKQKERYAFANGAVLQIERGYNFNQREDRASSGYIIAANNIPIGAYVLTNYLALEPGYELPYQHDFLTEKEIEKGFKAFCIPEDMVFCYKEKDEWIPCEGVLLTLRIFKPYIGSMVGIEPEVVKNRMYVVKGVCRPESNLPVIEKHNFRFRGINENDLSGKVVLSELNCDYEIIFHNEESREERVIRTLEREIIGTDEGFLKDLKKGKYLIGFSPTNCKPLKELLYA